MGNSGAREAAETSGSSGKKEAVGKFWGKKAAETRGSSVKKEAVGNSEAKKAAGTRRSSLKKRLWEILGKKRLRELGVPL